MKRLLAFIKTTTLGGLFVLLPIVIVASLATTVILAIRAAAQGAIGIFVGKQAEAIPFPIMLTIGVMVVISFFLGLAMISQAGRRCGGWIERKILIRVPGYIVARAVVGGLANTRREGVVKPVLMTLSDGVECFALIIETHSDGRYTIYIPNSPNPSSGSVRIVKHSLVRELDGHIPDIAAALQQWGMGSAKLLANLDRGEQAALTQDGETTLPKDADV
jgi:uncharacterized membrane protein